MLQLKEHANGFAAVQILPESPTKYENDTLVASGSINSINKCKQQRFIHINTVFNDQMKVTDRKSVV